jgi:hypothetical protein
LNKTAPFVPDSLSDSSITSLAGIVRQLSSDELRAGIQEQLDIFQASGISLENFSDYLDQNLWSDRTRLMDGLALDSYSSPSLNDILKVRLLGLYEIGFHPEQLASNK